MVVMEGRGWWWLWIRQEEGDGYHVSVGMTTPPFSLLGCCLPMLGFLVG